VKPQYGATAAGVIFLPEIGDILAGVSGFEDSLFHSLLPCVFMRLKPV
jgi:hypothetical protein